jgi:hypothetical protein
MLRNTWFVITPNDLTDDYDWRLLIWQVMINDVFVDSYLFVDGNWSGSSSLTGTSPVGVKNIECASDPAV